MKRTTIMACDTSRDRSIQAGGNNHAGPSERSVGGDHIKRLVSEEHRLYSHSSLQDSDREQMAKIQLELDQCWNLLRQRRALRDVGLNPNEAQVRAPEVVEKYEQYR